MEILAQLQGSNGTKISAILERGVTLLHEMATLQEDLKALAEEAKEGFEVKPAEFNKLVKVLFDTEMLEKKRQEVSDLTMASNIHEQLQSYGSYQDDSDEE